MDVVQITLFLTCCALVQARVDWDPKENYVIKREGNEIAGKLKESNKFNFDNSPDEKSMLNVLSQSVQRLQPSVPVQQKLLDTGCECDKATYNCGCCLYMDLPDIYLNDTVCANVTYLADQYGISLTVSLDGKVWYNETISAKNPPPVCFGVPYLKQYASLCVDFYSLDISNYTFSGCVKLEARLEGVLVEDYDLGCFKLPLTPHWASTRTRMQANQRWFKDLNRAMLKRKMTKTTDKNIQLLQDTVKMMAKAEQAKKTIKEYGRD